MYRQRQYAREERRAEALHSYMTVFMENKSKNAKLLSSPAQLQTILNAS